jgi:hypothetical protein
MKVFKRRFGWAFVGLLPLTTAVCEESATAVDGAQGQVTASVHDSAAVLPEGRTQPEPPDSTNYDGVLSGSALVEVYSAAAGWVSLGEPVDVAFDVYCEQADVAYDRAVVPVGTYTSTRLTLTGFVAELLPGGVLHGSPIVGTPTVALGSAGTVTIEKAITPFEVVEGGTTTLVFDLNSEEWLDAGALTTGVAASPAIASATRVYLR